MPNTVHAICTGNPLRKDFLAMPEKSAWAPEAGRHFRILILGGSQGAKILNDHVPEALSNISDLEIRHQTGSAMRHEVEERYQSLGARAEVTSFIEDMIAAYQWADLVICRAGAMTVSEVAASGVPTIFIPLLNSIDDHQTANASYLCEAGAALMLPQRRLNTENLSKLVTQARSSLVSMSKSAKSMAKMDASKLVADICIAEAMA